MFPRLSPRMFGMYTMSWCTSRTTSRDYCTPHGLAIKKNTATLACASSGNCSRAQKLSVWLYLSRCVTARKTHPWRGGQSHHDHAHQRTPSQAQHPGTNLGHPFGVLHPVLDPWTSPAIRGGQCQQTNDKPAFQQHVDNHPKKTRTNTYIFFLLFHLLFSILERIHIFLNEYIYKVSPSILPSTLSSFSPSTFKNEYIYKVFLLPWRFDASKQENQYVSM